MPMRLTIGISLAFMVISAGAGAKTPESSNFYPPGERNGVDPGKAEPRVGKSPRLACKAARARARSGPPDAYLGPVHAIGRSEVGTAAWYNRVGGQTSSGEILDTVTATAAHRSLPLASYARVTSVASGRSVIVKINDRGPWTRRFIIDLSPRAAEELDVRRTGVAAVVVEPVATGPAPPPGDPAQPAPSPAMR